MSSTVSQLKLIKSGSLFQAMPQVFTILLIWLVFFTPTLSLWFLEPLPCRRGSLPEIFFANHKKRKASFSFLFFFYSVRIHLFWFPFKQVRPSVRSFGLLSSVHRVSWSMLKAAPCWGVRSLRFKETCGWELNGRTRWADSLVWG